MNLGSEKKTFSIIIITAFLYVISISSSKPCFCLSVYLLIYRALNFAGIHDSLFHPPESKIIITKQLKAVLWLCSLVKLAEFIVLTIVTCA